MIFRHIIKLDVFSLHTHFLSTSLWYTISDTFWRYRRCNGSKKSVESSSFPRLAFSIWSFQLDFLLQWPKSKHSIDHNNSLKLMNYQALCSILTNWSTNCTFSNIAKFSNFSFLGPFSGKRLQISKNGPQKPQEWVWWLVLAYFFI